MSNKREKESIICILIQEKYIQLVALVATNQE